MTPFARVVDDAQMHRFSLRQAIRGRLRHSQERYPIRCNICGAKVRGNWLIGYWFPCEPNSCEKYPVGPWEIKGVRTGLEPEFEFATDCFCGRPFRDGHRHFGKSIIERWEPGISAWSRFPVGVLF